MYLKVNLVDKTDGLWTTKKKKTVNLTAPVQRTSKKKKLQVMWIPPTTTYKHQDFARLIFCTKQNMMQKL